jgi:hypothetical protein
MTSSPKKTPVTLSIVTNHVMNLYDLIIKQNAINKGLNDRITALELNDGNGTNGTLITKKENAGTEAAIS